ncbi:AbrB/MazE/SpoVT family DNA-binding domain-containing protein [Cohnella zeiphila]|uniref:AbrB/MazE/SpoVT family DNA-binding domain-containing protein n=1 Tax=Cohnella zeiphila TaxID=2761120 RepID=A0A7X0VTV2_9BACL|nr:AbrB/MazE/SpoVT family DNA-binding domain-containing protein [Cohnella zeiphila]MBB6729730.1 AbrB/MazE/SpoVT family DNA-binding domain-containing protein [Cohnella zeiphila]
MKSTGMMRQVDELGRIVLPIELRRVLEVAEGDSMEFFVDREAKRLMLRKYRSQECFFCKSFDEIHYYREKFICSACLRELKSGGYPDPTDEPPKAEASDSLRPQADSAPKAGRGAVKRKDTSARLAAVMKENPEATQSQWARMIGVSASRVNQLLRRGLPE